MAQSYVYVIGVDADGPVKVGFAADVAVRLSALQIGCPDELMVHKAVSVPKVMADLVERAVHAKLKEHHRRGEWYNVTAGQAINAVSELAAFMVGRYYDRLEKEDEDRDLFKRVSVRVALNKLAREAVDFYLSEMRVQKARKSVQCMNSFILQKAGLVSLELFKRIVINGDRIEAMLSGDRRGIENAYVSLASALNALAGYYAHRKNVVSSGNMKAA